MLCRYNGHVSLLICLPVYLSVTVTDVGVYL